MLNNVPEASKFGSLNAQDSIMCDYTETMKNCNSHMKDINLAEAYAYMV